MFTPIAWRCYLTGTFITYMATTDVRDNLLDPISIGVNAINEFFFIISDIAAEIANDFYNDWFSFAFWLGDLVYRLFVVRHENTIRL